MPAKREFRMCAFNLCNTLVPKICHDSESTFIFESVIFLGAFLLKLQFFTHVATKQEASILQIRFNQKFHCHNGHVFCKVYLSISKYESVKLNTNKSIHVLVCSCHGRLKAMKTNHPNKQIHIMHDHTRTHAASVFLWSAWLHDPLLAFGPLRGVKCARSNWAHPKKFCFRLISNQFVRFREGANSFAEIKENLLTAKLNWMHGN